LRFAGHWVISETTFTIGLVVYEGNHIRELKIGLTPRASEVCDVGAKPAFIAKFQRMRAADMAKDITPVIVVFNKVPACKAVAESHP
jgi:hypothetical protein